jgi:hypothetical protein
MGFRETEAHSRHPCFQQNRQSLKDFRTRYSGGVDLSLETVLSDNGREPSGEALTPRSHDKLALAYLSN